MGLTEVVMAVHGNGSPNTHHYGQNPIDGMFITLDFLTSICSGYLAFGKEIPSNHCELWMDIPIKVLGWTTTPKLVPIQVCHFNCIDQCIVK